MPAQLNVQREAYGAGRSRPSAQTRRVDIQSAVTIGADSGSEGRRMKCRKSDVQSGVLRGNRPTQVTIQRLILGIACTARQLVDEMPVDHYDPPVRLSDNSSWPGGTARPASFRAE